MQLLKQHRLMIWKHWTIRKRQPIILSLEFLWPLAIFLIITSVRHIFPPEPRNDCVYRARAMPSAGLLPFMQSFLCNLDNECESLSSYEEIPIYKNGKIGHLLNKVYPLIEQPEIQTMLSQLPTLLSIGTHAIQSLSSKESKEVLSHMITVGELFKDTEAIANILVENKMDPELVKTFLNATIDLGQLLRLVSKNSSKGISCQPEVLSAFIKFENETDAEIILQSFCNVLHQPSFLQSLIMQVNVRGLIEKGVILLDSLGSSDIASILRSFGKIVDALQSIPILNSLATAPIGAETQELSAYLQHAMEFLKTMKDFNLDLDFLGELMDDIERIAGPGEVISHMKAVGKHIHRLISWSRQGTLKESDVKDANMIESKSVQQNESDRNFKRPNLKSDIITTKSLAEDLQDMLTHITYVGNKFGGTMRDAFPAFDITWKIATTAISILLLPEFNNSVDFVNGLASVFETFPGYLPSEMRMPGLYFITAIEVLLKIGVNITKNIADANQILLNDIRLNSRKWAEASIEPAIISQLTNLISSEDMKRMANNPGEIQHMLCSSTSLDYLLQNQTKDHLKSFVCQLPLKELAATFAVTAHRDSFMAQLENALSMNGETDVDTAFRKTIRTACLLSWELYEVFQNMTYYSPNWKQIISQLPISGQDDSAWRMSVMNLRTAAYNLIVDIYTDAIGDSLEKNTMSGRNERVMNNVGSMVNLISEEFLRIPDKVYNNLASQWPWVAHIFLNSLENKERVAAVVGHRKWTSVICNQTEIDRYLLIPDDIHSQQFLEFFCSLSSFVENEVLGVNWFEKPSVKKVRAMIDDQFHNYTKTVWKKTFSNVRQMLSKYGVLVSVSLDNMQQIEELYRKAKHVFTTMNITNVVKLSVNAITTVLEFVDRQLETIIPWGWKHIKALISVLDIFVQYTNQELEKILAENKVETSSLTFGLQNFTDLGRKIIKAFPEFTNALTRLLTSRLGDFIGRIFQVIRLKAAPCEDLSITNLIDFSDEGQEIILDLERTACTNWKFIISEIIQYPMMFKMLWKFREATRDKDLPVDWNELTDDVNKLVDFSSEMTTFKGAVFPDVIGFRLENANEAVNNFVDTMNMTTTKKGLRFALVILDAAMPLLENVMKKEWSFNNITLTEVLMKNYDDYSMDEKGELSYVFAKVVMKTFDISLSDLMNYYQDLKVGSDGNLSSVFTYLSSLFGKMFESFPHYVNSFLQLLLNGDFQPFVDKSKKSGSLSFYGFCESLLSHESTVKRNSKMDFKETVFPTLCKLVSQPAQYFTSKPYSYSWMTTTIQKLATLWQNVDHNSVIVHFVDIIQGIGYIMNKTDVLVGSRLEVRREFNDLVGNMEWKDVVGSIARLIVKAKMETWLEPIDYKVSSGALSNLDSLPVHLVCLSHGTMRAIVHGLKRCEGSSPEHQLTSDCTMHQVLKNSSFSKLWQLLDDHLIDIFKIVYHSLTANPSKIKLLLDATDPFNLTCSSPETFFTVPETSNLNNSVYLETITKNFCGIEWNQIIDASAFETGRSCSPDIKNLMELSYDFSELIQHVKSSKLQLPSYLSESTWENVMNEMTLVTAKRNSNVTEMFSNLIDKCLELNSMEMTDVSLQYLYMAAKVLWETTEIVNTPLNDNIWRSLKIVLSSKTETLKLLNVLEDLPKLASTFMNTAVHPTKLRTLLKMIWTNINSKSSVDEVCHNFNLSSYFVIPLELDVSFVALENLLCKTDWTSLIHELKPYSTTALIKKKSSFDSLNFVSTVKLIVDHVLQLSNGHVEIFKANITDLPWTKKAEWRPAVVAIDKLRQNLLDTNHMVDIAIEYISIIEVFPTWTQVESYLQFINLQVDTVLREMKALNNIENFYSVVTNVTSMKNLVRDIHRGVKKASQLLQQYAVTKQIQYFNVHPNDTGVFCRTIDQLKTQSADLSSVEEIIKGKMSINQLLSILCHANPDEWLNVFTSDFEISGTSAMALIKAVMNVLPKNASYFRDPEWNRQLPFNWTMLSDSVRALNFFMRNPPEDFYPNFEWKAWMPVLQTFGYTLPEIILLSGETMCPLLPRINYTPFKELLMLAHNQLMRAEEYEKLICDLPYMNLSSIYHRLKYDFNLIETFRQVRIQIMNISMAIVDENDSSCPPLFQATSSVVEVLNELIIKYSKPSFIQSIEKCFQKDSQAVIIKEVDKYSKLISKGLPLMNFPNITSFTSSTDIKFLVETILDFMKFQIPVFFPLKNILIINNTLSTYLHNTPAEEILMDGIVNLNMLASTDYKPAKLVEILCNDIKLGKFIKLSTGQNGESKTLIANHIFCPSNDPMNRIQISEMFLSSLDINKIRNILPRLQMENLLSWNLVVSVGRSIGNLGTAFVDIKAAIGHINFKEAFNDISLHSLANSLLPLMHSTSLRKLSNGLEIMFEVMSPIIAGSTFEGNLADLVDGVTGAYQFVVTKLRNETIPIKEIVSDVTPLSTYLLNLSYPKSNLESLLKTSFNISALLFDKKITRLEDIVCDLNIMPALFNLKSDLTTAGLLHRALCEEQALDKVNRVLDIIFGNLNIMGILKNEMHLFMDPITKKLQLDPLKVKDAFNSLYNAQDIFPVVIETFYSLQTDPNIAKMVANLNPSELARGEITSSLIATFGDMLCGHPIRTFEEYFRLLQTTNDRPPVEKEKFELQNLPTDFCQNLYKQVAYRPAGSVIWGFLKPFIRGKLLFSPDNEYTRKIISQLNMTFVSMASSIEMMHEWSNGFKLLQQFIENQLPKMEALILLPIPNSISVGLLGPNMTKSMSNISGILSEMGNPQKLLGAASALSEGLQCFEMNRFIGFANEDHLEQSAKSLKKSSSFLAAIVFNNFSSDQIEDLKSRNKLNQLTGLPKHIEYKIRMDIDDVPTTKTKKERFWKPGPEDNFIENMRYLRGFVELQDMVDRAIISMQSGDDETVLPGTFIQQFPYPCYAKDDFGFFLRANVPAVTTLAWIFIVAIFVRELVLDRELMVYQVMLVMGLKAWIAWTSWFINCVIVMFLTNIGCTIILKYGGVFPNSDPVLLFIFLFVFSLSTIMFCYLVSIWFEKATIAAIGAVLLYLVSYLPFIIVLSLETQLSLVARILMNLVMSTSFSQGCMYIARFEEQEEGIQWSNIWKSPIFGDNMCLAWTIIMMAVDTIIYFGIATYFSALINAFRQSIKKKWYIIFYPILNLIPGFKNRSKDEQLKNIEPVIGRETYGNMTKKDSKARVGISVRNLTKVYYPNKGQQIVAVEDLTMDFYEGQITSLLGQTGSGKTTIINMLIGLTTPKSGFASIYDRNITTEFEEIRKNLGVCPQYNILFELMTIREHLEFYGSLKGNLKGVMLQDDVSKMLEAMKLRDKENERACNLSGGIRRRLSVAIAFVGGSRTIILDEPTSGVDPIVRRSIWDLVVRSKKGRTILLTTHHMDEAEILSDLVVIIHHGKTLCHGPPMELKKQFGSGYLLNISKSSSGEGGSVSSPLSSSSKLKDLLNSSDDSLSIYCFAKYYIPNVFLLEDNSSDMVLCLPYCNEEGTSNQFAHFFKNLEEQKTQLGVSSYYLSSTTLEQVFMNICLQSDAGLPITTQGQKILVLAKSMRATNDRKASREENIKAAEYNLNLSAIPNVVHKRQKSRKATGVEPWLEKSLYQAHYTPCTGTRLKCNQFKWLLAKRLHHFSRNWRVFITCIVLPCIFVAMAMGFTLIRPIVIHSSPSLLLTPSLYGPSVSSFIKVHQNSDAYGEQLSKMLRKPPGIGTTCMEDNPSGAYTACKRQGTYIERQSVRKQQCNCEVPGHPVCNGHTMDFTYDKEVTNTTDIIYDLIYANVTDWLMATHLEFTEQRYGGWVFGVPRNPESIPGSEENTVAWFNNKGYHAMPSYINSISNALLRERISNGNDSFLDYGISTYSHPLHLSKLQLGMEALLHHIADVGIAVVFLVAFSFIPAGFVMYLVKERVQGEKRLQYLSGVGPLLYWTVTAFFDVIILTIPVGLSAIIITIFDLPIYTYGHNFVATLAMLFMFGWATTPLMYILEKIFDEPSLASIVLFCTNVFIGVNTTVCTLLLYLFQTNTTMEVANQVLRYLFLVFPQFAFAGGLIELTKNYIQAEVFMRFGDDTYTSPFSMNILGLNLIVLGVQGVVFFAFNLFLEYAPSYLTWFTRKNPIPRKPDEDVNVKSERERVTNSNCTGDLIRLKDLTKCYNGQVGETIAVNNLSLSVPKGECFGLLGINGAGKTTTFHMLTGEVIPTSGEIYYKSHRISSPYRYGSPNVGYCPQLNSIDDLLSAEELLSVYAGLKGIPDVDVPLAVYKAIVQFQLEYDAQNIAKTYSNGTKRKLCAAIAVLGNPELVLMDEPTTGMDPTTRRLVWQNIKEITKDNRSVILTSHNMEECDALCTRLAIMMDGQFQCLGSPRYLKDQFGDDYTVTVFIKEDSNISDIVNRIVSLFPGVVCKSGHGNTLEFVISCRAVELGELFKHLEIMKAELCIQDFSVSRTTLDQIFVDFVKHRTGGHKKQSNCNINNKNNVNNRYMVTAVVKPQLELAANDKSKVDCQVTQF